MYWIGTRRSPRNASRCLYRSSIFVSTSSRKRAGSRSRRVWRAKARRTSASSRGEGMPNPARKASPSRIAPATVVSRRLALNFRPRHLNPGLFPEAFGLIVGFQRVEKLVERSIQHRFQLVDRQADTMVRDPILGEIVGADLLATVSRANHPPPLLRQGLLLLAALDVQQARAQHLQGLRFVLVPGFLVLAGDDEAGRQVRHAHGRVGRVDRLTTGTRRAEGVDAQLLGLIDLELDLPSLGKNGHGHGGGMDAAGGLRLRHPLDSVHPRLVLQPAVDPIARDKRDGFLDPADPRRVQRQGLDSPASLLGVAGIHPEDLRGEQAGLVPAGACADLEDDVFLVVGIARGEQAAQFLLNSRELLPRLRLLLAGQRTDLLICVLAGHHARLVAPGFDLPPLPVLPDDRFDVGVTPGQLAVSRRVGEHQGVCHLRGQLLVAALQLLKLLEHRCFLEPWCAYAGTTSGPPPASMASASSSARMATAIWSSEGSCVVIRCSQRPGWTIALHTGFFRRRALSRMTSKDSPAISGTMARRGKIIR